MSAELEIIQASEHEGLHCSGILYPNHPLRSFARRRALCQQDENKRRKHEERRGATPSWKALPHFGEQTHELSCLSSLLV